MLGEAREKAGMVIVQWELDEGTAGNVDSFSPLSFFGQDISLLPNGNLSSVLNPCVFRVSVLHSPVLPQVTHPLTSIGRFALSFLVLFLSPYSPPTFRIQYVRASSQGTYAPRLLDDVAEGPRVSRI